VSAGAISDAEFKGLCAALGHPEMAEDPRFDNTGSRMQHLVELVTLMRQYAAETNLEDFLAGAEKHDVPASAILKLEDLATDPQVLHNRVFEEREHPSAGRVREPRPAARLSATPQRLGAHAPLFGQHSDEIVRELGLDPAALRQAGIIH
jgi:crotonobetainyl-CoA:carnitine CoA-transferase CaiB-like acyl-CoA transferase